MQCQYTKQRPRRINGNWSGYGRSVKNGMEWDGEYCTGLMFSTKISGVSTALLSAGTLENGFSNTVFKNPVPVLVRTNEQTYRET